MSASKTASKRSCGESSSDSSRSGAVADSGRRSLQPSIETSPGASDETAFARAIALLAVDGQREQLHTERVAGERVADEVEHVLVGPRAFEPGARLDRA